tara:strand:- start:13026 stop:13331 length:306 start_codon:yes stop_codon:yes gene_type:complete
MFPTNFKWHEDFYKLLIVLSYILYFFAFTGIVIINASYLENLTTITSFYVAIILIIRFNPFTSYNKFTNFDKQLVWASGLFLFISSSITAAAESYIKSLKV